MTRSEPPLHVRVAEAIGWTDIRFGGGIMLVGHGWKGWPPGAIPIIGQPTPRTDIPRYDEDWRAAGPLIERYARSLHGSDDEWQAEWDAAGDFHEHGFGKAMGRGDTPQEAICALILDMHAQGKL